MHLIFEKQVLVDVVKDVSPLMVGGFISPFSEFATPRDELVKRVGYQDDPTAAIKEAKPCWRLPDSATPYLVSGYPPCDVEALKDMVTRRNRIAGDRLYQGV